MLFLWLSMINFLPSVLLMANSVESLTTLSKTRVTPLLSLASKKPTTAVDICCKNKMKRNCHSGSPRHYLRLLLCLFCKPCGC